MFKDIYQKEFIYWLRKKSIYLYALVFAGIAFLLFAGSLGIFDPISKREGLQKWLNSPASIHNYVLYIHKFSLILIPAIIGFSIFKDYKGRMHSMLYSYPIQKRDYLLGRFLASFNIVFIISLLMVLCFVIAEHLPGLDHQLMGPFQIKAYLSVLFLYIWPNIMILGLFCFGIVSLSRSIYAGYAAVVLPFIIQFLCENAFSGNDFLVMLFDPFAQNVSVFYQKDWNIQILNENDLPIDLYLIANRAFWLSLATIFFTYTYKKFAFVEEVDGWKINLFKKDKTTELIRETKIVFPLHLDFSILRRLKTIWFISQRDFKAILKNPIYWVIVLIGIFSAIMIIIRITQKEDFTLIPATQFLIGFPSTFFNIVLLVATILFSGLVLNKDKASEMDQLIMTTAQPAYVFVLGRFLGIIKMQMLSLLFLLFSFVIVQLLHGFNEHKFGLMIFELFVKSYIPILTWTCLAFFVHSLFRNLYLSLFLILILWMGVQGVQSLGVDSYLIRFNALPQVKYSDISGYGFNLQAYFVISFYWLLIGLILLYKTVLIWSSDLLSGWKFQFVSLIKNLKWKDYFVLTMLIIGVLVLGVKIYQAEHIRNVNSARNDDAFKAFENTFKSCRGLPFPTITSIKANLHLYPEHESFNCEGYYILENKNSKGIDTLLLRTGFDETSSFNFERGFKTLLEDTILNVALIQLDEVLDSGERIKFSFNIKSKKNSLLERNSNVLENGTILKHDIFPRFGYQFSDSLPDPESSGIRAFNYVSIDADKIDLDMTISITEDQYAIVPGYLVDYRKENGRSFYHYKTPKPIKFSFGVLSGEYEKQIIKVNDKVVELYIFHNNAKESVLEGLEHALFFNEENFSDYAYDTIRIIEYPITEGTYSTAFGNNLVLSEARMLTDISESDSLVDITYYVTAHEFSHHWWGNQLIPAKAKGATMLTESLNEYLMLRILEKYKGRTVCNQFYSLQKKRYEYGKKSINYKEPPLALVSPEQQFISYGKGAVVLYDLSEIIGKEEFNQLLSSFLKIQKESRPYPTSIDFIRFLKNGVDSKYHKDIDVAFFAVADN